MGGQAATGSETGPQREKGWNQFLVPLPLTDFVTFLGRVVPILSASSAARHLSEKKLMIYLYPTHLSRKLNLLNIFFLTTIANRKCC